MADHWTKKAFLDAVKRNDVEFIKQAIELGYLTKNEVNDFITEKVGPNGRDEIKTTLLGNAQSLEMIKCLVELGADVNQEYERASVHYSKGYQVVKCTRLTWCATEELKGQEPEKAEIFKFLIDCGAKVDESALFSIVSEPEKFYDLIDYVLKNNAREEGNPKTSDKALIRYAVDKGVGFFANLSRSLIIIYLLLRNGIPVEPKYVDQVLDSMIDNVRLSAYETKRFKKEYKRLLRAFAKAKLKSKIRLKFKALADKLFGKNKTTESEKEAE